MCEVCVCFFFFCALSCLISFNTAKAPHDQYSQQHCVWTEQLDAQDSLFIMQNVCLLKKKKGGQLGLI